MKTNIKLTPIASIAAALFSAGSLAAAPATPLGVNTGVSAIGNAAGGMHGPAFGGLGSGTATGAVATPGSTSAGSAGSGALSATGEPGLSAGGNASGIETIGMRQARLSAQAADNASVHGGNANAGGMDSLNASLNTGPAIDGIQDTKITARDKLRADVDATLGAGEQAMARIAASTKHAKEASQADFSLAQKAVIAREKELKASVAATAGATADTWVRARQRVAVAFSAYAAALAQAQLKATEISTGAHANASANASATAALAMGSTPAEISEASLDARDGVDADLRMKMEASEKAMTGLADGFAGLGAGAKASIRAAVKVARAREKDLKKSLKVADRAGADTWEDVRASVTMNYNLYAEAVAHAEAAAMAQANASGSATVVSTVK